MAFFLSKSILGLKNILDTDDKKDRLERDQAYLDDASAIQRVLCENESQRPVIQGILAINIQYISLFPIIRNDCASKNFFCEVTARNYTKKTKVILHDGDHPLQWNQVLHIPMNIVRNYRHPFNYVKIQLWGFSEENSEFPHREGSVSFHIHDVIQASPLCGIYDLWHDNLHIGDLSVEMTFTYGNYGYGYSYQISEEDVKPAEKVQYSLFPRVNPRYDQCESGESILEFKPTTAPISLLQMEEPAVLNCAKDMEVLNYLDPSKEPYHPDTLLKECGNIQAVREKYFSMTDRVARLMFLSNYLSRNQKKKDSVCEPIEMLLEPNFPSKTYKSYVTVPEEAPDPIETEVMKKKMTITDKVAYQKTEPDGRVKFSFISTSKVHPEYPTKPSR